MSSKKSAKASKVAKRTLFDHFAKPKPVAQPASPQNADVSEPPGDFTLDSASIPQSIPPLLIDTEIAQPIEIIDLQNSPVQIRSQMAFKGPGKTRDDPILLEDTPAQPTAVFPIFAKRPVRSTASNGAHKTLPSTPSDACLPSALTQHILGPQLHYQAPTRYPRRLHKHTSHDPLPAWQFRPENDQYSPTLSLLPTRNDDCLETIPPEHIQRHPAVSRATAHRHSNDVTSHKLWTEEWRPTRAEDVLGNERHAIYLREWLKALSIQMNNTAGARPSRKSTKRPRIVRSVSRQAKKKQRLDSWIVDDEEEEDEPDIRLGGDEDDFFMTGPQQQDATPRFNGRLTNTIILSGPLGCGKTSAVYACAEELGWEVFEVYPGVGRRNGANLDNLVGDVGKNHLVQAARGGEVASPKKMRRKPSSSQMSEDDEDDEDLEIPEEPTVRQSLILLEEVDVLFRDDTNFWPAVVNLVKQSRRPVICTCNDPSLVPLADLPIQTTLEFKTCTLDVAVSYLQGITHWEGLHLPRDYLTRLYEKQGLDLRRTIGELQMGNLRAAMATTIDSSHLSKVGDVEHWSYVDSWLGCEDTLDRTARPSADDELGYTILYDYNAGGNYQERDGMIGKAAIELSRGALEGAMFRARVQDGTMMKGPLGELEAIDGRHVVSREEFWLDYLPFIRQMAAVDDVEEAKQRGLQKRATRNSQRYIRTVSLTEGQRWAMMGLDGIKPCMALVDTCQ